MNIRNRRALCAAASDALAANPGDPRKVALFYIVISAVSSLVVSLLGTALGACIADLGGLSNMGLRTGLSTVQAVLPLAQAVAMWGLHLGYQKTAMRMARCQEIQPANLLDGFRIFGPLLRVTLIQGALYFLLAMGVSYITTIVCMLSPLSGNLIALAEQMAADPAASTVLYSDAEFLNAAVPIVLVYLALYVAITAPLFYRFRMTNYCVMDNPRRGALAAMTESSRMMRSNRLDLLKLDLSFWWFYLGQAAVLAVLYGDELLPMLGVELPWSAGVSFYVFYVLALVLESGLYYLFMNRIETAYATAYDALRPVETPTQGGAVLGNIFDLARGYQED